MIISSAEFLTSAFKRHQYPDLVYPEIAFVGRSNVGKSSLINTLVNRKRLVKTSSKPGHTQLINFFVVNNMISLVDLPGYGYAKVPFKIRKNWGPMVETYFKNRELLKAVVFILDVRRKPGQEEFDMINWLNLQHTPIIYILTKADKLSKNKLLNQVRTIENEFQLDRQNFILFSAKTRIGRRDTWSAIQQFLF